MHNFDYKKIVFFHLVFMLSFANRASACEAILCEFTQPFASESEANAHIASQKPVTSGMIMATIWFNNLPVLKILTKSYTHPLDSYPAGHLTTPLGDAIDHDAAHVIHYLIREKGVALERKHVDWAVKGSHRKSLEALLHYKVDIHGKNYQDRTPLQEAQKRNFEFGIKLLQEYEAKSSSN